MGYYPFPKLMGILNVTPDSFSDGGLYFNKNRAIEHGIEMIEKGADIIDIGGESSRPGAAPVSIEDELNRVIPVIEGIRKYKPDTVLSIDTTKLEVAEAAIANGVSILNDISGLDFCPELADLAAKSGAALVLMHMQGKPLTMQERPVYSNVVQEVYTSLEEKIKKAKSAGVTNIFADVGIGFGKSVEDNLALLRNHDKFENLGVPLLLGISRKSFIGSLFGIKNAIERDVPTAFFHSMLFHFRIEVIRIHNIEIFFQLKVVYNSMTYKDEKELI